MPSSSPRRLSVSIDVTVITPIDGTLSVLVVPSSQGRERWSLPWGALRDGESPDDATRRLAQEALGRSPSTVGQAGVLGGDRRHPGDAELSVACFALVPMGSADEPRDGARWVPVESAPTLAPRHRLAVNASLDVLQQRIGDEPIAFRLLPTTFTLSELQSVYEMVLGRGLHKASFRRTLQAADVVEPTDAWRSEGRGRPAQLFRFTRGGGNGDRRLVRFDF